MDIDTEYVRESYAYCVCDAHGMGYDVEPGRIEFDRWLAAHDAEVLASQNETPAGGTRND